MSGTREGGLKASAKNKELYGEDFFKKIGSTGGSAVRKELNEKGKQLRGFALNKEKAREAGRVGGSMKRVK